MSSETLQHEFFIPAYGDSPYLENCVASLNDQRTKSAITIVSSTPSNFIRSLADRLGVRFISHLHQNSIGVDWNKALENCESKWVTLAHQDDFYYPEFAAEVKKAIDAHPDAIIIFTDYDEIKDGNTISGSSLVRLKRILLELGFWGRERITSKWAKTNCIRFACAIPCPAVTIRRDTGFRFNETLKVNLDWDAWLRLAQQDGSFVWIRKPLMAHRIHAEQESSSAIKTGVRQQEDLLILKRLWPSFLAQLIEKTYRLMR